MSNLNWQEIEDCNDLDVSKEMWEELVDLKDAIFFVDLAHDHSIYYRPLIASELGGYIHIRNRMGKILYSCHVKNNTIFISSMPSQVLPTSNLSVWECRLEDDHREANCTVVFKQKEDKILVRSVSDDEVEFNEPHLLNLPFDILEIITRLCVCVEYMNFRATCKRCRLAAPPIQWSNEIALRRLETYSLVTPWLMVLDRKQGIISFTDPILGHNYFKKTLQPLMNIDLLIHCSRFGWLLLYSFCLGSLIFFNPFTNDLRKLPQAGHDLKSLCFSAPPTFPDCMVVGFSSDDELLILIHFVAREPSWRTLHVGVAPYSICFPTFIGRDLYTLHGEGELIGFKDLGEDYSSELVDAEAPISCTSPAQYYLMKCGQDLLQVIVGKFGEPVEVFKWNDAKLKWEKIDSVGKHMIYICGATCFGVEAKTPEMENKICFPLLHSKNKMIVFYSPESCTYHTFNGENVQEHLRDICGTTYPLFRHTWIEPSWS